MSEKKLETHLQLCVFSSYTRYRVVNLESFEGFDAPFIEAYGFDAKGYPIFKANEPATYKFSGSFFGSVNLNHSFTNGIRGNKEGKNKIFGYDAIHAMLSSNGCVSPSTEELETKISALVRNGIQIVYFYKKSSVAGMSKGYGFKDSWFVTGESPKVDLEPWNILLKELGSDWRVLTEKTARLGRKLEFQRLSQEKED